LVTIKRYDKFITRLGEGLKLSRDRKRSKKSATTVGVYDILPTNCMRKAFYRRKLGFAAPEPVMQYFRGRAVEGAIASLLLASSAGQIERNKRHEKGGIACYADLCDSKRIIEIKEHKRGQAACP
jgi:hypothetical protein